MAGLFKKIKGIFGAATNIVTSEGPKISYEHTKAAFNLIKLKTENRILLISSLASVIFLGFYGYLIYLNINPYSLRHIIIYSILGVILFSTFIVNVILNPSMQNKLSTLKKIKVKKFKSGWKGITTLIATLTKLVSLGFMLYEIITIDSSIKRLIPFGLSTVALMGQIAINYISRLIVSYYEILLVGIDEDINSSGVVKVLTEGQIIDPIKVSGSVDSQSVDKISHKLSEQINNSRRIKDKDYKDQLYKAASFCRTNPITLDGIMERFEIGPNKANKILNKLEKLGIISKGEAKVGKMIIDDPQQIKYIIYSSD